MVLPLAGSASAQAPAKARYVDAADYPAAGEGWEASHDLERRLARDFDQICGDTFCEGDYSDYQPLRLRCSVNAATGMMKRCLWTFAASELSVEPATGHLRTDTRAWACPIGLSRGLTRQEMIVALAGPAPLFEPMPHGGAPIYDSLIDCL
ncbi:MAG TPA: hypothetical protein VGC74_09225 [Stenotrophomonas sp.]